MIDVNDPHAIIGTLEHTKLAFAHRADVVAEITQLCEEAKHYGMATVCVRPEHVGVARRALGNRTNVLLAAVVAFPAEPIIKAKHEECPVIGACASTTKMQEISSTQMEGVEELDIVLNVAFLKTDREVNGDFTLRELKALRMCAGDMPIKLILETDLLTDDDIVYTVRIAVDAELDMIKTSTGFITDGQGAQVNHIRLIRKTLDEAGASHMGIKASGGVRTLEDVKALLEAGATRIGTSVGVLIAKEALGESVEQTASTY